MKTEHDPDSDSSLLRPSRALLAFAMVKAAGVIVAIPSVVLGGFIAEKLWNQRFVPWAWMAWSIGCLSVGVLCDVVGRIGCWWTCRRTRGKRYFLLSVTSQSVAIATLLYQTWIGWTPLVAQGMNVICFGVLGQGAAAILFILGLDVLAQEQHWVRLERQTSQFRRLLATLACVLYSWFGLLCFFGILAALQVVAFFWFVPLWLWMPFYFVVVAVVGGVLVVGLFSGVEIQYLRTLWRLVTEIQSDRADARFRKQA